MPADASALQCPNCGAPAESDSSRCRYCKARLATVSCPSCFALMFEGTAFCPKCGARRTLAAADAGADLRCPGCRKSMQRLDIRTTSMLECEGCDGLWVDADTFEHLCADKEAQSAVIHRLGGHATAAKSASRVNYRPCPRCRKMMNRINFGRISGVVVDVCKGHGTYLDPGELHAIVEFIHGGGLERARTRQIEELKEQERRLADAEHRLARERLRGDPHQSGGRVSWTFMVGDD
jgi:Zn-finger nucleic acid-binding protein